MEINETIEKLSELIDNLEQKSRLSASINKIAAKYRDSFNKKKKSIQHAHKEEINKLNEDISRIELPMLPRFVDELPKIRMDISKYLSPIEIRRMWSSGDAQFDTCPYTPYDMVKGAIEEITFNENESDSIVSVSKKIESELVAYHTATHSMEIKTASMIEDAENDSIRRKNEEIISAQREIQRLEKKCKECAVLHENYYYLAEPLLTILKTRRADNLEDALNIAIREEEERNYQKEQLKIQEKEAEQRNRILQAQADEQRRNNELRTQLEQLRIQQEHELYSQMVAAVEENNWIQERQRTAAAITAKRAEQQAKSAERQAKWDEQIRKSNFNQAKRNYEHASFHYNNAVKSGNAANMATYKRHMDHEYAEMLKHK